MARSLNRLLNPKSIAVIGGKEAARVVEQCLALGYSGDIWPMHPTRDKVHGLRVYHSVDDLPGPPDAAFIAVNRTRVPQIAESLCECGAGGAICYASGFAESDAAGGSLQEELVRAAGNMPLIGPNCYGLLNYADGVALWPDQHGGEKLAANMRGVAILTQSSNIAISISMQRRGLPIAYIMTAGNQAQTGLSELALNLLDDDRVTSLGLHIEGFDSVCGFEQVAAKAREMHKPIVALKMGRSAKARESAFTHTASLAGSDRASDAFLKRIGIARVNSLSSFLETLKLLHVHGALTGRNISSISCSGGEASLMADGVGARAIQYPEVSQTAKTQIENVLGPLVTIDNPLDYHTYIWGNREGMETIFTAMLNDEYDLNCLVLDIPRPDRCDASEWMVPVEALNSAAKNTSAKAAIVSTMQENLTEEQAQNLIAHDIAPMMGIDETMDAIEASGAIGKNWEMPQPLPLHGPTQLAVPEPAIEYVPDEAQAKKLLAQSGITVPENGKCSSVNDAVLIAEKIGYPVVLKLSGIAHKSEMNGVKLNLGTKEAVLKAATELSVHGNDFLIEEMISDGVFELLIGITHDAQFGPVMTIATGGVLVEVFDDSRTLLLPASREMILEALAKLKSSVFFDGFRGSPKADFQGTIQAIITVQEFALENVDNLIELDINPLIIRSEGNGAVAADALVKFRSPPS